MKRLIYISMLLLSINIVSAQALYKLGMGDELNKVQLAVENQGDVYIFEVNSDNQYQLKKWDGISYSDLGVITSIPKHGVNVDGQFALKHALWYKNDLYVLGKYDKNHTSANPNQVFKWNGNTWSEIASSSVLKSAHDVTKLIEYQNELYLAGIFKTSS